MGKLSFGFRMTITLLAIFLLVWLFFGNLGELFLGIFRFGYSDVYIPQSGGAYLDPEKGFFKVMIIKENDEKATGAEFLFYSDKEDERSYEKLLWKGKINDRENPLYFDVSNCQDKLTKTLAVSLLGEKTKGIPTRRVRVREESFEEPDFYYDLCNPCENKGKGTKENPYTICNCNELENISSNLDAHYILGNNINCNNQKFKTIGNDIDPFKGTLNGKGYFIYNLTINEEDSDYIGLIGVLYKGTVKNIGMINTNIKGNLFTASLVGRQEQSQISKSYSKNAKIKGTANVGGLVGNSNGLIEDSFVTGEINATVFAGGLVGGLNKEIKNSYFVGDVNAPYKGMIGKTFEGHRIKDSFYDSDRLDNINTPGGFSRTSKEMKQEETYKEKGWDFDKTWTIKENSSPTLQKESKG